VTGWWGGLSVSLTTLLQCQREDFPAGLHWIKYRSPMNFSYPDEVSGFIDSKVQIDFNVTSNDLWMRR
jgi:hypothetical protein